MRVGEVVNLFSGAALSILTIFLILAILHVPVGNWMYRMFTDEHDWAVERWIYRLVGVDPRSEQRWTAYAMSVVAFGVVSVVGLFTLIMVQRWLPWDFGRGQDWHTALNTAVSFTTNTNWQSYAGESGAGYVVSMLGLTVQNFVSAATGIAVAGVMLRGLSRQSTMLLGNFWVDLTRACLRLLLPISVVGALILLGCGVIQNLSGPHTVEALVGGHQVIQGGPVASQEVIKLLGTNGGGFFNANSAHPFENPGALSNLVEIVLVLLIASSLPWTYGRMVGDRRQGFVVLGVMASLWTLASAVIIGFQAQGRSTMAGGLEGLEYRFGIVGTGLFAAATTGTSTGGVNAMHDSLEPIAGGMTMFHMMLGEVSPGGVGTGLYGMLVYVVIAVFISGLMVGRTPELLGKTIGRREITFAALITIVMPTLVLIFTGISLMLPSARAALLNSGPHGLTEMMYAYVSAANNNGSAFAGLNADQPWLNLTLATAMFIGRFLTIVLVLGLAGTLAAQAKRPTTSGTMPTGTLLFGGLLMGVVLIVAGLTFFPALALGPIAEALS